MPIPVETVSTVTRKSTFLFDVVLQVLEPSVVDADLLQYEPNLASWKYSGQTTFSAQIEAAFNTVLRDIKNKGRRPAMLLDGAQVHELVILKSLELIFGARTKSPDDIFRLRLDLYADRYRAAFAMLQIVYDEDESGTIDGETASLGQLEMVR